MLKVGILTMCAATLMAQGPKLEQEGPYWVRTLDGVAGSTHLTNLHVSTNERVVLRGSAGDQVTYRLTERVRANSEAEARRLLDTGVPRVQTYNNLVLSVSRAASARVLTELQVNVPRGVNSVLLETHLGDIDASDLDGDLQALTTGGTIHCDRIRGSFFGTTQGGEIHAGKVGGVVRCTNGAGSIVVDSVGGDANLQTAGGEIAVHDAGGALSLSTAGGNIRVDRAASSVEAHTGEGVIEVGQAGGLVIADTRAGSIQVGSARGVRCESARGPVRVRTLSGPLSIAAMGSILAELMAGARLNEGSLVAGAGGDVTVRIPSNFPLSVIASNQAAADARIWSDFPGVPSRILGLALEPGVMGMINGGGPLLRINVAGGNVYLQRLK